jgi:hypothetical protein
MWLTVLGGMTVLRNEVWSSTVGLWLEAVERSPQVWVPHLLLGEALHERGASEQALAEYRMAVRLRPDEPTPYMKVGLTLAELHRFDEAAAAFQQLESKTGGSAMARNGTGRRGVAGWTARRSATALRVGAHGRSEGRCVATVAGADSRNHRSRSGGGDRVVPASAAGRTGDARQR